MIAKVYRHLLSSLIMTLVNAASFGSVKDVQYFVQLTNKSNNLGRHSLEDLNCIDRNSPSICYFLPHTFNRQHYIL